MSHPQTTTLVECEPGDYVEVYLDGAWRPACVSFVVWLTGCHVVWMDPNTGVREQDEIALDGSTPVRRIRVQGAQSVSEFWKDRAGPQGSEAPSRLNRDGLFGGR